MRIGHFDTFAEIIILGLAGEQESEERDLTFLYHHHPSVGKLLYPQYYSIDD